MLLISIRLSVGKGRVLKVSPSVEKRMKAAMLKYSGIKEIPDTVSFSP